MSPGSSSAEDDLLLECADYSAWTELDGLVGAGVARGGSRGVEGVAELAETVEAEGEDVARGGDNDGVVGGEDDGGGLVREIE
jgi:hypothetical protein